MFVAIFPSIVLKRTLNSNSLLLSSFASCNFVSLIFKHIVPSEMYLWPSTLLVLSQTRIIEELVHDCVNDILICVFTHELICSEFNGMSINLHFQLLFCYIHTYFYCN